MENSYILNNYVVIKILENLSLEEMLKLRTVSKQFNECVDRALKSQKELRLSIERSDRDSGVFGNEILISDRSQDLGENQIKKLFEPLLNKFETLKTLILRHKTSSIWYFEWLNKLFPDLKSVEIEFICDDIWDNNKLLAFKSVLGSKCEKIVIKSLIFKEQTHRYSLIVFPTNDSFVLSKLRRITIANSGFHSDFCENMEKAFPNIEYVCLKSFEIYCRCAHNAYVCFNCYKQFLTVCTKVYERKLISKKMSSIDLQYYHTDLPMIVFSSMFETFVETKHSFKIEIRKGSLHFSNSHSTVRHFGLSLILDSMKGIAYRNPEIQLCFKVGVLFKERVKSLRKRLPPNLKIGIIGESNDENELCIYFDETSEKIVVKLGSNTTITKMIRISFDSIYLEF